MLNTMLRGGLQMYKRFAVVKEWFHTVSAEDECIQRIVESAKIAGYQCDIVDQEYRLVADNTKIATEKTHDFVLHIHFCSSKINNLYSFCALWNPVEFYHSWGYRQNTDNLMSHDAFLSCDSPGSELQIKRLIAYETFHSFPTLKFHHSLDKPYYEPSKRVDRRIHYCGMNWERLGSSKGRYDGILKFLDQKGLIDIYGPELFQGVRPWEGFTCYRGEILFDGHSLIDTINKSGIGFVLSSEAHKEAEMISNRLFEALVAGAIVIADENPIVRRIMGNNAYYIDPKSKDVGEDILNLIDHINTHSDEVFEKIKASQKNFNEKYKLSKEIKKIYENLEEIKIKQENNLLHDIKSGLCCIYFPGTSTGEIESNIPIIIESIENNFQPSVDNYIVIPTNESINLSDKFLKLYNIKVVTENIEHYGRKKFGKVVCDILSESNAWYFSLIMPGEKALKNHFSYIIKCMERDGSEIGCSDTIRRVMTHIGINYKSLQSMRSSSAELFSGAFVFKKTLLDTFAKFTLPHIDYCATLLFLAGAKKITETRRFSLIQQHEIFKSPFDIEVIKDARYEDKFGVLQMGAWVPPQEPKKISKFKRIKKKISKKVRNRLRNFRLKMSKYFR